MTYQRNAVADDAEDYASAEERPHSETKFAALTASLLARKGEAEPAMEAFAHARVAPGSARQMRPGARHVLDRPAAGEGHAAHVEPIDDTNDVREEWQRVTPAAIAKSSSEPTPAIDDAPRMTPRALPATATPQKEFAENCPRQKIATSVKRAAVTFRMSVHDFLRLKLASAELEVSSQDILIDALGAYLDEKGVERLDECACLAKAAQACGDKGDE
jgi:hypothetical protein